MRKFNGAIIGVDQGSLIMFSDFEDGGEMWSGTGKRESRRHIGFKEPFATPPIVHVGLAMWDLDTETNARGDLHAEKITEEGFDLVFRTWADTRVARIRTSWTAIGEARADDGWELY